MTSFFSKKIYQNHKRRKIRESLFTFYQSSADVPSIWRRNVCPYCLILNTITVVCSILDYCLILSTISILSGIWNYVHFDFCLLCNSVRNVQFCPKFQILFGTSNSVRIVNTVWNVNFCPFWILSIMYILYNYCSLVRNVKFCPKSQKTKKKSWKLFFYILAKQFNLTKFP